MSAVRFYTRNGDGSIEGDETCLIDTQTVERLEKDFTVLGQSKTFVIEFGPPLHVRRPVEQGECLMASANYGRLFTEEDVHLLLETAAEREEIEAMRRAFRETPIGMAAHFSTFAEGWKAYRRHLLDEEHEVWTCMTCGLITEGQSCLECGSEAMPGRWERAV